MNMHVPTLHNSRCHHRGISERTSPIAENTANTVLEAVISWCAVFPEALRKKGYEVAKVIRCTDRVGRQCTCSMSGTRVERTANRPQGGGASRRKGGLKSHAHMTLYLGEEPWIFPVIQCPPRPTRWRPFTFPYTGVTKYSPKRYRVHCGVLFSTKQPKKWIQHGTTTPQRSEAFLYPSVDCDEVNLFSV